MKHISKYLVLGTPKCISRLDPAIIPEEYRDYELQAEPLIYVNMAGGWTEEECDDVLYIVERSNLEQKLLTFKEKE